MQDLHTAKFIIGPPQSADALSLVTMHGQSWLDTYPNEEFGISREWVEQKVQERKAKVDTTRERIKEYVTENDPNKLWLLAKDKNGEVIGFLNAGKETEEGQQLQAVYVSKDMQGKGLAHELMKRFLAWYDPSRQTVVWATTYNKRAIRFYEKYGFKIIEGTEKMHHEIMPIIQMKKEPENEEQK